MLYLFFFVCENVKAYKKAQNRFIFKSRVLHRYLWELFRGRGQVENIINLIKKSMRNPEKYSEKSMYLCVPT